MGRGLAKYKPADTVQSSCGVLRPQPEQKGDAENSVEGAKTGIKRNRCSGTLLLGVPYTSKSHRLD